MRELIFAYDGPSIGRVQADIFQQRIARRFFHADFRLPLGHAAMRCRISLAGPIQVCDTSLEGGICPSVCRERRHIRSDASQIIIFWFPLRGTIHSRQYGREETFNSSRFGVISTRAPFAVEILPDEAGQHASLTVSVANDVIEPLLPSIDRMGGLSCVLDGAARIARDSFCGLGSDDGAGLSDRTAELIAASAMHALSDAVSAQIVPGSTGTSTRDHRVMLVRNYIHLHISDPELTASRVATQCSMSLRYLHLIFQDHPEAFNGKTFRRYVRDRRLTQAWHWLRSQGARNTSIAQIAFKCGFVSDAHFCRAFRERFGQTPSQTRNAAIASGIISH